jgi:osmoprotectant transport system substrate-binding protein
VSRLRTVVGAVAVAVALTVATACGNTVSEQGASQQPQGAALRIRLGTQDFPEAKIMGELWRQALAVNGYTVDLQKGVGPAGELDKLLADRRIDGHVAYTGTVLSVVAGQPVSGLDPQATYDRAKAFYATRNMSMSAMTPFENKDAIATTRTYAQTNQLKSIADLKKLATFRLGARPEFNDLYLGRLGLEQVYGLANATFAPVPVGEQYAALDTGTADAVDAFTTDPQLLSDEYEVLADPQLLFGSQNVVMTVDSDKLKVVGQEKFLAVVDAVNSRLTQDVIVGLNAAVTNGGADTDVARRFLQEQGLLEPIRLGAERHDGLEEDPCLTALTTTRSRGSRTSSPSSVACARSAPAVESPVPSTGSGPTPARGFRRPTSTHRVTGW